MLLHRRAAPAEERHLVETAKLLVFLNLSFTYLKLERPAMALRYGEQALIIDRKNAKALFRCGQVSGRAGTWDGMLEERPQWRSAVLPPRCSFLKRACDTLSFGQACLLMTEYQKARDFLVRAQREQPFNHDINNELKKLAR